MCFLVIWSISITETSEILEPFGLRKEATLKEVHTVIHKQAFEAKQNGVLQHLIAEKCRHAI